MTPKTLYQKISDSHVALEDPGQPSIIYIDRPLIHEGTSPQAFAGLRAEGRKVRRPDLTFAVMDHSVSTTDRTLPILDNDARLQFEALEKNCRETSVRLFDMNSKNQGIVHIIGPELGITQPGQTIVCRYSHTSTHGAFCTRAFVPRGKAFQEAVLRWKQLRSDDGAKFDLTVELHAEQIAPQVTWGTNPGMVTSVTARVPDPHDFKDLNDQKATESALKYMGLKAGTPIVDIPVDRVFIGSCTNSRLDDLRAPAPFLAGPPDPQKKKPASIVSPASRPQNSSSKKRAPQNISTPGF